MDVTWLGHGCFRLRGRNAAVVTDPFPPSIGLKLQRLDADLVTVSHEHDNHNYTQAVRDGYEIRGPGEYEVAGVSVTKSASRRCSLSPMLGGNGSVTTAALRGQGHARLRPPRRAT